MLGAGVEEGKHEGESEVNVMLQVPGRPQVLCEDLGETYMNGETCCLACVTGL